MSFEDVEDVHALSPMQEGLLFHSLSEPGSGVFIDQVVMELGASGELQSGEFQSGELLDVPALQAAWQDMVARHGMLRAMFLWDGLDEPLQVVRRQVELPWELRDARDMDEDQRRTAFDALLISDRQRGFDLSQAPLLRMTLWRVEDRKWIWLWTFHHIILDGWSVRILLTELKAAYKARLAGDPLNLPEVFPFTRYIAWHAQQDLDRAREFWQTQLDGFESANRLDAFATPQPQPRADLLPGRPIGSTHRQTHLRVDPHTTEQLSAFAREFRLTLGTVLMGAWAWVLGTYSRDRDLVFGLSTSGRRPSLDGIEQGVGLFIETLPLRVRLLADTPWVEWLRSLQRQQMSMHQADACSLAKIQQWTQLPQTEPLFETLLVIENHPPSLDPESQNAAADGDGSGGGGGGGGGLRISRFEIFERSNYPFALLVLPGASLELIAVFDRERFAPAFVDRLLARVETVLGLLVRHPQTPLGKIPLLSDREQRELVERLSKELSSPPIDGLGADPTVDHPSIHHWISEVAAERGDHTAVICGDRRLTYGQLDLQSDRLAARLRRLGVDGSGDSGDSDSVVGIYARRSPEVVVGILGILKAGGAYLPLDAAYPEAHVRTVLEDAGVSIVLTQKHLCLPSPDLVRLDLDALDLDTSDLDALDLHTSDLDALDREGPPADPGNPADSLAYVIYTSGSTGKPKGVEVSHGNLLYSTCARLQVYEKPVGRFLLLSSFAFDSSVAGLFWTLVSGGTLVLPEADQERDLEVLRRLIPDHGVTHSLCLPALYEILLEESDISELASLEVMIVAGEACPSSLADLHRRTLPGARLFNEYGPTEGTVWSTVHEVVAADSPDEREGVSATVPIGRPIPGTTVLLLDPEQRPVPQGLAGELWVSGPGLARGYLHRPEATRQAFPRLDPPAKLGKISERRFYRTGDLAAMADDGNLMFLGRADSQVKIRGHRIEIEGIEAQLRRDPRIAEVKVRVTATVTAKAVSSRLTAFVVPTDTQSADPDHTSAFGRALQQDLKRLVPDPMVPDQWIVLPELPRLPNGKLDEPALRELAQRQFDGSHDNQDGSDGSNNGDKVPTDPIEATIAEVWRQLLGVEQIARQANFFELGGDSILGIRLVSRLRQAGLAIEPRELAAHPTIEALANVARERTAASDTTRQDTAGQDTALQAEPWVDELPLLPIQRWFLDRRLTAPHHWNMTRGFEVTDDFELGIFAQALDAVVAHHDSLRATFERVTAEAAISETTNAGWCQRIVAPEHLEISCEQVDLAADESWQPHLSRVQGSLRLDRAPLLKALLCRRPNGPHQLFLVVHHLIIDAVSWTVVHQDLETAYDQLLAGRPVSLEPVPTPIKAYVDCLLERLGTPELNRQLGFWTRPVDARALELPGPIGSHLNPRPSGTSTEADAQSSTVSLELGFSEVGGPGRPEELMLTALALAMARLRGHGELLLEIEGHGRLPQHSSLDMSRTVGWLTVTHPVHFELDPQADPGAALAEVRARLDRIPEDGSGFGVLRWLEPSPNPLESLPEPRILFNYLGRPSLAQDGPSRFRPMQGSAFGGTLESSRHGNNERSHDLEINAGIEEGRLEMSWTYLPSALDGDAMELLIVEFVETLQTLIGSATAVENDSPRVGDFPDAGLDADDFAHLLDELS